MVEEVSADGFELDLTDIIEEYKKLRMVEIEEDGKERIDQMIEACKMVDGKTFADVLNLVDTGVFNPVISAYCKRVMRDAGVSEEKTEEALIHLEELFEEPAEEIVLPELSVEVSEEISEEE